MRASSFLCAGLGIAMMAMTRAEAATIRVGITDYTFSPPTVVVHRGDSVVWANGDSVPHTATAMDGKSFDTGTIDPGASAKLTFTKAGTYRYRCSIHPDMLGTVDVK